MGDLPEFAFAKTTCEIGLGQNLDQKNLRFTGDFVVLKWYDLPLCPAPSARSQRVSWLHPAMAGFATTGFPFPYFTLW